MNLRSEEATDPGPGPRSRDSSSILDRLISGNSGDRKTLADPIGSRSELSHLGLTGLPSRFDLSPLKDR